MREKYQSISIITGGGEKDRLSAVTDSVKHYAFAIILIIMVISLTFQSVLYLFFILTALPLGLSVVGRIDSFVQPIALVLGWGLFVATCLTRLCLPAIISFFPMLQKKKILE